MFPRTTGGRGGSTGWHGLNLDPHSGNPEGGPASTAQWIPTMSPQQRDPYSFACISRGGVPCSGSRALTYSGPPHVNPPIGSSARWISYGGWPKSSLPLLPFTKGIGRIPGLNSAARDPSPELPIYQGVRVPVLSLVLFPHTHERAA